MRGGGTHEQVTEAMRLGWAGAGNFSATIISAMLIGYLLDRWLGTRPWLVIIFIIVGSVGAFYRMVAWSKEQGG